MKATIKAFLQCVKDPENVNPNSNAVAALRDLMKRVIATSLTNTTGRFQKVLEGFYYSQAQRDFDPANNVFLSIDAYMTHRRINGGGYISFLIMEIALALDLPDSVVEHPVLQRILNIAIDIGILCNDVCSYNREQSEGHYINVIPVAMNELGLNLQGAIDYAAEQVRVLSAEWVAEMANVPSWDDPEMDKQVAKYLRGLQYAIKGNAFWHLESGRYFNDGEREEIKCTMMVMLRPRVAE